MSWLGREMSPRFLLTLFAALYPASSVHAGVDVERALEAFHSTCLAHGDRFDRAGHDRDEFWTRFQQTDQLAAAEHRDKARRTFAA
ncbi:hypothetical protein [Mesorhizobium sp.]|uniref:hypothetical protein n=2 Tax=Phyllobacteriaceae TaxID=69277 RepID=UPI000FE9F8EB|nr:hypothetical protein [Mesorhizobium sp.]RWP96831.1 MAG: hypothetical protein EOR89_23210 [Mesorhizobium sp.]RWQ47285.1 MAG: hypothetical protein EOS82_20545 [Mesorhizobium sp.]